MACLQWAWSCTIAGCVDKFAKDLRWCASYVHDVGTANTIYTCLQVHTALPDLSPVAEDRLQGMERGGVCVEDVMR